MSDGEWQENVETASDSAKQASGGDSVPGRGMLDKATNALTTSGSDATIQDLRDEHGLERWEAHLYRCAMHLTNSSESNAITDMVSSALWFVLEGNASLPKPGESDGDE